MPAVKLKKPKAENFDEIEYDSDDPDFAHELDNMQEYELEARSNNKGIDESNRLTQMSAFYNHTPSEWRKLKEDHNDSMDHLVVDDCYFEQENSTKIPGFSFQGKGDLIKKGYVLPPSSNEGRPSELVYMNNWNRETNLLARDTNFNKSIENPFGSANSQTNVLK